MRTWILATVLALSACGSKKDRAKEEAAKAQTNANEKTVEAAKAQREADDKATAALNEAGAAAVKARD